MSYVLTNKCDSDQFLHTTLNNNKKNVEIKKTISFNEHQFKSFLQHIDIKLKEELTFSKNFLMWKKYPFCGKWHQSGKFCCPRCKQRNRTFFSIV